MIRVTQEAMEQLEKQYPGFKEQVERFESMKLPRCPDCGSGNTASVVVAIIGRTLALDCATTKIHLDPKGWGSYFCNRCKRYFN